MSAPEVTPPGTGVGAAQVAALLEAHAGLRRDLATIRQLLASSSRQGQSDVRQVVDGLQMAAHDWQVRAYCDRYCRIVEVHHGVEDQRLFPALRRLDPELRPLIDRLATDHQELARLLGELQAVLDGPEESVTTHSLDGLLTTLGDALEAHLAREEEGLIPAILVLDRWV